MEFTIMPDNLYGASASVNGKWLGIVESRPISFTVPDHGEYYVLAEFTPLQADPGGDVYPIPIARVLHIRNGEVVAPIVEPDESLHLRRSGSRIELHYRYPKADAPTRNLETLPHLVQVESIDLDKDGRLDSVETFASNKSGHIRIRLADGAIAYEGVFPDPNLRLSIADVNRDGRPDVMVFWTDPEEQDSLQAAKMMLWESPDGSIDSFNGLTGVKRIGAADVLFERTRKSPYRVVTEYLRYTRQPGESAVFVPVRAAEEQFLQRAESLEETAEAFLTALELQDDKGAELYLARGTSLKPILQTLGPFYAHHLGPVKKTTLHAAVYEWVYPNYYDREKKLLLEFAHHPDKWSDWKLTRVVQV
ncbi:FG-GAP repeat domain-containing protein [Tumebacillus permanentifrigoris]|uniref:VCBS repeat protein n=1 Tax=Tumebacillus permanentifrigoris TaxID=378543 RepID=A0A316DEZ6_9BACL|nr:VCBS repeat-containing protein [Tumebacillus permanentifrigoris]PWK14814.1 hypothetical protein C7459_10411 [Tumebacillus permanentifrigoris]